MTEDSRYLEDRLNAWVGAGLITPQQAREIGSCEGLAVGDAPEGRLDDEPEPPPPRLPTHTTLVALFDDVRAFVREHPGATLLNADDPGIWSIGWTASKTEGDVEHWKHFTIGVRDAKATVTELPSSWRPLITSPGGRHRIAEKLATLAD